MPILKKVEVRRHDFSEVPGELHYLVSVSPVPQDANMEDVDFQVASSIQRGLDGLELDA